MMTEQETQGRAQTNITWKSGNKETFQAAFEAWSQGRKGAGAGDFVMELIRRSADAGAAGELDARIEALGIKELVEMHRRRSEADARMLEQIAEIVADARGKAEAEVMAEMEALRKSRTIIEESLEKATREVAELKAELDKAWTEHKAIAAKKDEIQSERDDLVEKYEAAREKLEALTATHEEAARQLDQERQGSIGLKERAVSQEAEINRLAKLAGDADLAYKREMLEAQRRIAELEAGCAGLDEARSEADKANAELAEARLAIARLEERASAQAQTVAGLTAALEAVKGMAPKETPKKNAKTREKAPSGPVEAQN